MVKNSFLEQVTLRTTQTLITKFIPQKALSYVWQSNKCTSLLYIKRPFADVLQNRCFYKFRKFDRKTHVLGSLFNNNAGLKACNFMKKRLQYRCFPVNIAKFLRTHFLQNTSGFSGFSTEYFPPVFSKSAWKPLGNNLFTCFITKITH